MKKEKFSERCRRSPDLYHKTQQLGEQRKFQSDWSRPRDEQGQFHKELVINRLYGCTECKLKKEVLFDAKDKPLREEDMKTMAYLFARDFIQPSHPHYEMLYGKTIGEEIRKVHRQTHEANKKTTDFKDWNQDFKGHYAKAKHHF